MSMLPARPNLEWLRKQAKQVLRGLRTANPAAKLAEAQLSVARHHGFTSWRALKSHIEQLSAVPAVSATEAAALLRAVGNGAIDTVRATLAAQPHMVNCTGQHPFWGGQPQPLHVAIETHREDMVELLLAAGANVNAQGEQYDDWTPLMLAVSRDWPEMSRVLLARGARIGLVEALLLEDDALVARFLERGKRALPESGPNRGSILAFARTPFAIDRLLELGVPVDQADRWGATPLEALSRLGPRGASLVRHLQSRGLQARPQEHARLGDQERLATLLATQPELVRADAVMMGAVEFEHHGLVKWLLEQGANVNAHDGGGWTALHAAAWNGDLPMAQLLVAAGADATLRDQQYRSTAAHCAEVAINVTNNSRCRDVAAYLRGL